MPRGKAKAKALTALAALVGPIKPRALSPIGGLPVAVSATAYRVAPSPALSGLRAAGSGLGYTAPAPYYGKAKAPSGPIPAYTPTLVAALGAKAPSTPATFTPTKRGPVKGRTRRSRKVALRVAVGVNPRPAYAAAPLIGPASLPLPASGVKYVGGGVYVKVSAYS